MASEFYQIEPGKSGDIYLVQEKSPTKGMDSNAALLKLKQPGHLPVVAMNTDNLNISLSEKETFQTAFLHVEDTLLNVMYRKGWRAAISEYLVKLGGESADQWKILGKLVGLCSKVSSSLSAAFPSFLGHGNLKMEEYSNVIQWEDSLVKALAWHPHVDKVAVAYANHSVKIHSQGSSVVPMLKHRLQKSITCLAWQCYSSSILAVGCANGIFVWHVDPNSLSVRPSTNALRILPCQGHCPITSLVWSPEGRVLLSASVADTSIRAWSVPQESFEVLSRKEGGGNSLLRWSADGSKVLCATACSVIRVWDTNHWTCEKWSDLSGRCKTACWSANSQKLLFTTTEEPVVYCLTFSHIQGQLVGSTSALPVFDLHAVQLPESLSCRYMDDFTIEDMVWDKSSTALALLIKGKSYSGDVLLFRTALSVAGDLEILPCGAVLGRDDNFVQTIAFTSTEPVLSVIWSTGSMSYVSSTSTESSLYGSRECLPSPVLYSLA